jgi:uncharacterized protein (DUF1330 family)
MYDGARWATRPDKGGAVSAYVVASYRITNPEAFAEYPAPAIQTILQHGGEVLAADQQSEVVEGEPAPVTVILRFPSKDAARTWYRSDEYQQVVHLRTDNTEGMAVFLDEFVMPEG